MRQRLERHKDSVWDHCSVLRVSRGGIVGVVARLESVEVVRSYYLMSAASLEVRSDRILNAVLDQTNQKNTGEDRSNTSRMWG